VRTKHGGKVYGDLWGQSTILETILGSCPWAGKGRGVTDDIKADHLELY